jgi:prophage regulatory protein
MPKPTKPIQPAAIESAAFLRERQLVKGPNRLLPFSAATLWRRVNAGDFPAPLKLTGGRMTVWRTADVAAWIARQGAD